MVPQELVLQNFMCYRGERQTLSFEGLHVACLSGENGAGKSTLLDAITWVLWGKARVSDDNLITQGEQEMMVRLTFYAGGQRYRVIRRRRRAGSSKSSAGKSWLDLQIANGETWRSITESSISATERAIQDALRMRYDTFINASFLLQGRADEFTRKTPGERKQVLADILDLEDYAHLEERAKARVKSYNEHIYGIDGLLNHLRQEADKLPTYEQLLKEAQTTTRTLTANVEQLEKEQQQADERVRELEAKAARLKEIRERINTLAQDIQQQTAEISGLQATVQTAEKLLEQQETIREGKAALVAAQEEMAHLESLRAHYDELIEQRRERKDQLKDERRVLLSEIEGFKRDAERTRQTIQRIHAIEQRGPLSQQMQAIEAQLNELQARSEEWHRLREQRTALDEQISRVNALLLQRHDLLSTIAHHRDTLRSTQEEQQRLIDRLNRQLGDIPRWEQDLAEARQQQLLVDELTANLASQRERGHALTEQIGACRSRCAQIEKQAKEIKERKDLLVQNSTTACPLCGSDLGREGMETVREHYDQEIEQFRHVYREALKGERNYMEEQHVLVGETQEMEDQLQKAQRGAARAEWLQQQLNQAQEWQSERDQAQTTLAEITATLEQEAYEPEARATIANIEATLQEMGRGDYQVEPLEAERAHLQHRLDDLEQQLEQRVQLEREAASLQHTLEEYNQAAATLPDLEQQIAERETKLANHDYGHEIRQAGRQIEEQLHALGYTPEGYTAARARVHELQHWAEEEYRLNAALSTLERDRNALNRAESLLERYHAEQQTLTQEAQEAEQHVRELPQARRHARDRAHKLTDSRQHLEVAQRDFYERQTHCEGARDARRQVKEKEEERQKMVEEQGVYQEIAEACGKRGVQAMLIEMAIPELEREANRLLSRITDNQMHLTFEMQRSTKKGDILETLEIKIADALGTRTYDAFSGGEAMRINIAVRIALSRLLARRAGASLETLVIDEGFGALDAEGRERFVQAITSVQHDFKLILVITHLEDLKERFPAHIHISKTPSGSAWYVA